MALESFIEDCLNKKKCKGPRMQTPVVGNESVIIGKFYSKLTLVISYFMHMHTYRQQNNERIHMSLRTDSSKIIHITSQ